MLDKVAVHEHAARQRDDVDAVERAGQLRHHQDGSDNRIVETARYHGDGNTLHHVVEQCAKRRLGVEEQHRGVMRGARLGRRVLRHRDGIAGARLFVILGGSDLMSRRTARTLLEARHARLEQHRALAFVTGLHAHAEQRARRVEKPSHRGGHGRVQPAVDHGLAHARLIAERRQGACRPG